jgi:hypothetical protein
MKRGLLVVALLVLCGCDEALGPPADLRVAALVEPFTFRADEQVRVLITISNLGARTHWISDFSPCRPVFEVRDADGAEVAPAWRICSLAGRVSWQLLPGQDSVFSYRLKGDALTSAKLQPGSYHLRGIASYRVSQNHFDLLRSAPVTIQVIR